MIDWDLPLGEKIWLSGGLASEADTLCSAKGLWTYYQYFMDWELHPDLGNILH